MLVKELFPDIGIPQLKVSNPYLAFAKLLEHFYVKPMKLIGISGDAIVSEKAAIARGCLDIPFLLYSGRRFCR